MEKLNEIFYNPKTGYVNFEELYKIAKENHFKLPKKRLKNGMTTKNLINYIDHHQGK